MHLKAFIQHHPVATYFCLVFLISYGSFAVLVGPKLLRGEVMHASDAEYILFPIIVWGVCLVSLALTAILRGRSGLRDLLSRMGRYRVGLGWYLMALLTPLVLVLVTLFIFRSLVSPIFTPNLFLLGIAIAVAPGYVEEIGWMGYAFPMMMQGKRNALATSILLGILWGLWHLPVVDYLGAAAPHGAYWPLFALSFMAILVAIRVLIVWIYTNTQSILLAQLMHISSTACLVVLDPTRVSPAQETLWYAVYAAALWVVVALVIARYGTQLVRQPRPVQTLETAVR